MAHNTARMGRRRRVLNEEVRAARTSPRDAPTTHAPADTPRYGASANIENHPQITDLVPRRYRVVALTIIAGAAIAVTAETIAYHAVTLGQLTSVVSAAEITSLFADRLVAWSMATILLVSAGYAKMIFSLRRHRVDDYRGRYRVWRTAVWAAFALSLNAVVGGHLIVARILGHFTGWNLFPGSAEWWLAPAVLLGGWLLVKLSLEVAECRSALMIYVLAMGCFVAAGATYGSWSSTWLDVWSETLGRSLPLIGFLLLLAGTLLFARYVVLDVQGLIEHRTERKSPRLAAATSSAEKAGSSSANPSPRKNRPKTPEKPATPEVAASKWVDGSEPDSEDSASGKRRLSKAERKRLRKQKMGNRAA